MIPGPLAWSLFANVCLLFVWLKSSGLSSSLTVFDAQRVLICQAAAPVISTILHKDILDVDIFGEFCSSLLNMDDGSTELRLLQPTPTTTLYLATASSNIGLARHRSNSNERLSRLSPQERAEVARYIKRMARIASSFLCPFLHPTLWIPPEIFNPRFFQRHAFNFLEWQHGA
jgi:hypothetical protein